jgi:hypothetical protein
VAIAAPIRYRDIHIADSKFKQGGNYIAFIAAVYIVFCGPQIPCSGHGHSHRERAVQQQGILQRGRKKRIPICAAASDKNIINSRVGIKKRITSTEMRLHLFRFLDP